MIDLKAKREAAGMSQDKLAELCGVSRSTISMIEIGQREPSVTLAMAIGKALKFKWSKIFE